MWYGKQGKQSISGQTLFFSMVLLAFILLFAFSQAWADAICGGTIGPDETVVLENHILKCNQSPALTIEGPATLDLNGHKVTCESTEFDGIIVIGEGAIILNGLVMNCDYGIRLGGVGGHKVVKVGVTRAESAAFRVDSDGNYLWGNRAVKNADRGFRVDGNSNTLINNVAKMNNKGFRIDGNSNILTGNTADDNSAENFQIKGASNQLMNNIAKYCDEECFLIEPDNGGNDNLLFNNTAFRCGWGIAVALGALDNNIILNKASENLLDLNDLNDGNGTCDANQWGDNTFTTSDPDCIE